MIKKAVIVLVMYGLVFTSCDKSPEISDDMLDGSIVFDSSLFSPENYLQSYANPTPTTAEAAVPVILFCHGYTASTFEWSEFREWAGSDPGFYTSMVLLGGHGRSYEDFKASDWKDWQSAIIGEYERLRAAGYTNINLVGSSTSCALILELVGRGYFEGKVIPRNIFLIDPIVIPSSKILSLIGVVGPMIGYVEAENTKEERAYWYTFRPQETLQELQDIINVVRKKLEKGMKLPSGCTLKVYKSIKDPTADPVSAVLIYKGVKNSSGGKIDLEMVDSELHVYTRLKLREAVTERDSLNQVTTFAEISSRVKN